MDSLKFNKIAAGVLCAGLLIMLFSKVSSFLISPKKLSENAYPIKVDKKLVQTDKDSMDTIIEPILALLSDANLESGQKIAKKCTACHSFNAGGANKVGPNLYNIVNKEIGQAKFGYSKAFASLNGKWTYTELNKFLFEPKKYVKGTKMNFAGLKKQSDRANLVAWLRKQSDNPESFPTDEEIKNQ